MLYRSIRICDSYVAIVPPGALSTIHLEFIVAPPFTACSSRLAHQSRHTFQAFQSLRLISLDHTSATLGQRPPILIQRTPPIHLYQARQVYRSLPVHRNGTPEQRGNRAFVHRPRRKLTERMARGEPNGRGVHSSCRFTCTDLNDRKGDVQRKSASLGGYQGLPTMEEEASA